MSMAGEKIKIYFASSGVIDCEIIKILCEGVLVREMVNMKNGSRERELFVPYSSIRFWEYIENTQQKRMSDARDIL